MRWGKPTKNKKRRDPRYFLNEDILSEGVALKVIEGILTSDQMSYLNRSFSRTYATLTGESPAEYTISKENAVGPNPEGSLSEEGHRKILSVHKRLVMFNKIPEGVVFTITFSN